MTAWTQRPPGTRSGSTGTSALPSCQPSRRWCRGGMARTPCSLACWTGRRCTACWPRSRRSAWTSSSSASSHRNANHQNPATAAHLDARGHLVRVLLERGQHPVTEDLQAVLRHGRTRHLHDGRAVLRWDLDPQRDALFVGTQFFFRVLSTRRRVWVFGAASRLRLTHDRRIARFQHSGVAMNTLRPAACRLSLWLNATGARAPWTRAGRVPHRGPPGVACRATLGRYSSSATSRRKRGAC